MLRIFLSMVKSGSSPPVDRCGVFVEHFKVNQGQNSVLLAFQLGPSRNNSLPIPYTIPTFTSLDTVFPNTVIFRGSKSSHTNRFHGPHLPNITVPAMTIPAENLASRPPKPGNPEFSEWIARIRKVVGGLGYEQRQQKSKHIT